MLPGGRITNAAALRRIILNSIHSGSNKLIDDLDFFDVEFFNDCLILKMSFKRKEYVKYIFLKNLDKFDYLSEEN